MGVFFPRSKKMLWLQFVHIVNGKLNVRVLGHFLVWPQIVSVNDTQRYQRGQMSRWVSSLTLFYLAGRLGWQYFPLRRCCCMVCLHGDIKAASSWADYLSSMWADCIWLRWDTAEWLVCKESMHGIVGTFSSLQKTTGCCNNYCTVLRTVRWVITRPFLLISWFPLLVVVQVQQGLA